MVMLDALRICSVGHFAVYMEGKCLMNNQEYMRRAIELARKGAGWTSPNPMVGAVIVKEGRVIGEGWHKKCGDLHAERNAFAALTEPAQGATLYVTLEPCCHHGRTPPCTEAIIEHGIGRVVIGSRDPNPLVSGKGTALLRAHGIVVEEDFLREECDALNPVFFHYITTRRPYVVMKYAMTLDGKIATRTGASQWITGEMARRHVHQLRGRYSAIMAGIGTVLADDPLLNCRIDGGHQPVRIIVDSHLRIPVESQLVQTAEDHRTVLVCSDTIPEKENVLHNFGVEVLRIPGQDGRVDLRALMEYLGREQIDSVLIEGGGQIHEAALRAGLINHVCAYVAPKLFGGDRAITPVEGMGVSLPSEGATLNNLQISRLGEDLLLEYDVKEGMNGVYWNR